MRGLRHSLFWQLLANSSCPSGPRRQAGPLAQRARRYWARDLAVRQGHHASLSPTWVCADGAATPSPRPAAPRPRRAIVLRKRERSGQPPAAPAKPGSECGRARGGEPEPGIPRRLCPKLATLLQLTSRKREEEIGQWGVLGREWGKRSTSTVHPLAKYGVQVVTANAHPNYNDLSSLSNERRM